MVDLRSLRRPLLVVTAAALVALFVTVLGFLGQGRQDLVSGEVKRIETEVAMYVRTWERDRLADLDLMLEQTATTPRKEARQVQTRFRRRNRGVDSIYLWVNPPMADGAETVRVRSTLIYPERPDAEDTQAVFEHPCLEAGRGLSDGGAGAVAVADAYLDACAGVDDVNVRLRAASEAARFLAASQEFPRALQALDSVPVILRGALEQGILAGAAPYRLVTHRTQRAEILEGLGRTDDSLESLFRTGLDLMSLDAPALDQGLLQYVSWPILHQLDEKGWEMEAERLRELLPRAERRQRAWREIDERILPLHEEPISEPARFVFDQYDTSRPFLIYYGTAEGGRSGAALQLDQERLVAMFLRGLRPELRRSVTLRDAAGEWMAGAGVDEEPLFVVPFDETLTNLRVAVGAGVVEARVAALERQWRWIFGIVVTSALVSLLALFVVFRATLQQDRLLERQREFTTRVTHELKTPLAGIRLMAENVQFGAYKGPEQLQEMSGRIVQEADRLTERVNQILASARAPSLPRREPFDPEEALLDAIDTWGPRLDAAGIRFMADLAATAEVMGDLESVRDAVGCLLDNALKYRRTDVVSRVELTLAEEGKWVVVEVSDNGLGVPRSRRKEIFERFVRVEGPHRGLAGGHGLGLAQVAAVARAHAGQVVCTDGFDGGARFTLRLPARR
jgi:two-component system phosphate regulon sensor histidine kinase PhoR